MLKELSENPEKKFVRKNGYDELIKVDNTYLDLSEINYIHLDDDWAEIVGPVSFAEAFDKFRREKKNIICKIGNYKYIYYEDYIGDYKFHEDLIADGEWYIIC